MNLEVIRPNHLQRLNWPTAVTLALLHAGAVAACFYFEWRWLLAAAFLYWVATGLGISMGYHRLLTHRGYQVPLPLEYFFAACGALSLQGGPIFWAAVHRIHHQNSDKPGDPHSPRDGPWWAHMGWVLHGASDHWNTPKMARYAPDLARHRFYLWLNRYHWAPSAALGALLLALGGLPLMLWGLCARVVFSLHATWLVNSATHLWGARRFATRDNSRNNWWVALITFGEGWHNNHHAHPSSARHGLAWYEFDVSWIQIQMLRVLGVARSVRAATLDPPQAERRTA